MTSTTSPSDLYLLSLQSATSKVTMGSILNTVANKLQGVSSHKVCDWSQLSYEKVLMLISDMKEEGKSPSTMNLYLACIKGVAKASWMSKVIDVETYQWIKEVKRIKGTTIPKGRSLVVGELRKVINHCTDKATVGGTRDAAIFATLYSAGLRRAELINLQLSDINFITNEIKINGKGGKQRTTVVSEDSLDLIKSYLKVRGDKEGVLFSRCWKSGKIGDTMLSTQAIYAMVCNTTSELGLPKMSPHCYRKSFCTDLLENGTDIFTVSKLMGHSSIETTKVYDKRLDSVKNAASKSLSF